jgi:predicted RNase H-like nuclease (RuvC/YqgF family)
MQHIKEKFDKNVDILKKQTKIMEKKISITQIKKPLESLDQVENRISGLEDNVDSLEHSYKEKIESMNRTYKISGSPLKDQTYESSCIQKRYKVGL